MIEAGVGIPGSGKSFYAVYVALKYMASGGAVFSNIALHGVRKRVPDVTAVNGVPVPARSEGLLDAWELGPDSNVRKILRSDFRWEYQDSGGGQYHYIDLESMDDGFLHLIPRGSPKKRILLILDEVNEWFDSLDGTKLKVDAKYREMFKFLRLSRHYHIDVLFLLQDFSTLNARLRGLCAHLWHFTDMQKMRVAGVPFPFPFKWFLWQQFDNKGKNCLKTLTWGKDPHIFQCYDSFCEFGAVGLAEGSFNSDFGDKGDLRKKKGLVKKMTMFDRLLLVACCAGVVLCLRWGVGGSGVRGVGVGVAAVTVTNTVTLVQSPAPGAGAEKAPEKKRVTCEYVPYSFCDYGGWDKGGVRKCFALLRGAKVEKGMVTEHGMCVDLTEYAIRFVSDDGREHFIYRNDNGISADLAESEKPEKIKR